MRRSYTRDDMRLRAARARRAVALQLVTLVAAAAAIYRLATGHHDSADIASFLGSLGALVVVTVWAQVRWARWFDAVYDVARARGRARVTGRTTFWAWGWGGYAAPRMMVVDLWRAADPPGTDRPLPPAVRWWWRSWVATAPFGILIPLSGDLWWVPGTAVAAGVLVSLLLSRAVIRALTEHAMALRTV